MPALRSLYPVLDSGLSCHDVIVTWSALPFALDSFAELRTRAGVSIKTVSRVVNDQGEISRATCQRVLAAIEELGYRPDVLARGLVSGKTLPVGPIIPRITDPFFPEVVQGVESVGRKHGYSVFLCHIDEDP
jgi:DNA-binding LacI/PurR family transcriptional regulator